MIQRRWLLMVPLAAMVQGKARAATPSVSEVRVAGMDRLRLASRIGIPVVENRLQGPALAAALNAGHIEAALLDAPTLALARHLMRERLWVGPIGPRTAVIRHALPGTLHQSLRTAIA